MGCASSSPEKALPPAELRARIERAPPKKAEELERILGLKEALLAAISDKDPPTRAESPMQVLQRLKDGLGEYPEEVWAWPEGELYRNKVASLEAALVPKTNESIRQAVAEFKAESADFNSPKAEKKWGPVAYWDVSEVTNMDQ